MKKFYLLSAIMLLSVMLSIGVVNPPQSILKYIPRSAETVILADLDQIADLSDYSRVELVSMLCSQVSPIMTNIVSSMDEDCSKGVNWSRDIALFSTTDHGPLIAALELSDAAAVKRYLKSQTEREKSLLHYKRGDVSGCYNDDFYLLCDKNVLLLIAGVEGKDVEYFASMFAPSGKGFLTMELGKELSMCEGELRAASSANIGEALNEDMSMLPKEGVGIVMSVKTRDNVSDVEVEALALTNEAKEYLAQIGAMAQPLSGKLLKYIPESAIAYVMVGKSSNGDFSLNKQLESMLDNQADDEMTQVIESILGQIDGDVAVVVQGEEKSQFIILCQSKSDALLATIRRKTDCDWTQYGKGYVGKMGDMTLYMGYSNGVAAISTLSDVADLKYANKSKTVNVKDVYAYLSLDVKSFNETNMLQSVSKGENGLQSVERAIFVQMIASTFDEVEVRLMNNKMQMRLDFAGEDKSIYSFLK